jgi:hypothetical protein
MVRRLASPHLQSLYYPNFWQVRCVSATILDYFLALKDAGERPTEGVGVAA